MCIGFVKIFRTQVRANGDFWGDAAILLVQYTDWGTPVQAVLYLLLPGLSLGSLEDIS